MSQVGTPSSNPIPQMYASEAPQYPNTLPNSNQNPMGWISDYLDQHQPGWQENMAAHPEWQGASWMNPKKGITNQQANFMQDMFFGYDFPRIQGAADRQFARVNSAIGDYKSDLTSSLAGVRTAGTEGAETLRGLSKTIGQDANRYGEAAVADAQEGVRKADELAGTGTQSGVAAYQRSVQNNLDLMRRGTTADGQPMTMEQYSAMQSKVLSDTAAAGAQVRTGFEQQALQMRTNLSQTQLGAGGLAANVAGLSANLATQAEQLETSVQLAAAQLEAQGNKDVATLMLANPESVVSVSNALLNMWGVFMAGTPAPRQSTLAQVGSVAGPILGGLVGTMIAPGVGTAIGAGLGGAASGGLGGGGSSGSLSGGTFMNW